MNNTDFYCIENVRIHPKKQHFAGEKIDDAKKTQKNVIQAVCCHGECRRDLSQYFKTIKKKIDSSKPLKIS